MLLSRAGCPTPQTSPNLRRRVARHCCSAASLLNHLPDDASQSSMLATIANQRPWRHLLLRDQLATFGGAPHNFCIDAQWYQAEQRPLQPTPLCLGFMRAGLGDHRLQVRVGRTRRPPTGRPEGSATFHFFRRARSEKLGEFANSPLGQKNLLTRSVGNNFISPRDAIARRRGREKTLPRRNSFQAQDVADHHGRGRDLDHRRRPRQTR
jgi:hypothetical protein